MNKYNDKIHLELVQQSYKKYHLGQNVDVEDNCTYGYISEIIDNLSGLQAYVITDIKLPTQPTKTDLNRVSELTILYRGSSASFSSLKETTDTLMD